MKTVKEVLATARAKIEHEDAWWPGLTRGGRPRRGQECALTAMATSGMTVGGDAYLALERAMGGSIFPFNDTHSHAEVLSAFDKAIAAETAA